MRSRTETGATPLLPPAAVTGMRWPAIVADDAALLLALQYQLDASQWWTPAMLAAHQLEQVDALLRHAAEQVPFQARRLRAAGYRPGEALAWDVFRRIPPCSRSDVQSEGAAMRARWYPPEHGRVRPDATSGSTFEPIDFVSTDLVQALWNAFTLREHLWHRRDFSGRLAAIRSVVTPGDAPSWGAPADLVAVTGPGCGLRVSTPVPEQIDWLLARDPDYLMSYPSNLAELVRVIEARGLRLPRLREVRSYGEVVAPELREDCRRVLGVPLVDVYSAQEVGCIALQCPRHEHYHVQSEAMVVEILDDRGQACAPGEIGHVVVTSLHNFAMPFIRYRLGDLARVGPGCDCGRGLPVLEAIMGRVRNMAMLPDGRRFWPRIRAGELARIVPLRQFRLVQKTPDRMELLVVVDRDITPEQTRALQDNVRQRLGHRFEVSVQRVERIERGRSGKFEDFQSEIVR